MTVRPGDRPVTRPAVSTAAISGLADFQETRSAIVGVPSPRTAEAVTRTLSPGYSVAEAGSRLSIEADEARAAAVSEGALPVMRTAMDARRFCDRASILASPGLTPRTVPSFRTRAMSVSELAKVNLAEAM